MALINCPECNKQISDKAKSCPNCGFPIKEELSKPDEALSQFPELPNDLSIGVAINDWPSVTYFEGIYDRGENVVEKITPGTARVIMCYGGIAISSDARFSLIYPIHHSQIINLKQISRTELGSLNKDVVGRAAIGALIYGPAGAVIGALTAKKQHSQHYLIINYWDVNSKKAQSLIIGGDKTLINAFINRYEKEEIKRNMKVSSVNNPALGEIQITKAEFTKLTYRQRFAVTEYGYFLSQEDAETVGKMLGNLQSRYIPAFCKTNGRKVSSFEK